MKNKGFPNGKPLCFQECAELFCSSNTCLTILLTELLELKGSLANASCSSLVAFLNDVSLECINLGEDFFNEFLHDN